MSSEKRALWSSDLGFLLAAVGSAIGLGSIWRFAYKCHEHGGGAFLVPYLFALVVVGIPLMLLEYGFGHRERAASPLAFRRVGKGWEWLGWWMPVAAMFAINLYYPVVIGWCVNYLVYSLDLKWAAAGPEAFFFKQYLQVTDSPFHLGGIRLPILLATIAVWVIVWAVCYRDIAHGIEKACMVFMPLLFVLTLILVAWTLPLDGAWEAVRGQYLRFEWSKINLFAADSAVRTAALKVWQDAFGQVFFTMSLGFGIMIAYASYLPRKSDLVANSIWTNAIDTIYSLIAGVAVFGVVGFMAKSQGVPFDAAVKDGAQLAFVAFPKAIEILPAMRPVFGALFFLVCTIAGLASAISLVEAFACSVTDKFNVRRTTVITLTCAAGLAGSVLFTTRGGLLVLDILDNFVNNFGLVFGGFIECILVGWVIGSKRMRRHIQATSGRKVWILWDISVRYVSPLFLGFILIASAVQVYRNGYGGYPAKALWLFGAAWLGVCLVASIILSLAPWRPEKLKRVHHEGEDELLT